MGLGEKLYRVKSENNKKKLYVQLVLKGLDILAKEGLDAATYKIPYYQALIDFYGTNGDMEKFKYWGFKGLLLSPFGLTSIQRASYRVDEWAHWLMDPQKNFPEWNSWNRSRLRSMIIF